MVSSSSTCCSPLTELTLQPPVMGSLVRALIVLASCDAVASLLGEVLTVTGDCSE